MDAELPRRHLRLHAGSLAEDLGYVALADLADALRVVRQPEHYRLIGGHMVTLLAARWDLGRKLFRETKDADVGAYKVALVGGEVVARLRDMGYEQIAGNRFGRLVTDLDIEVPGSADGPDQMAVIDLLIAGRDSRKRDSVRVGGIVTTEVPGLATALARESVELELEVVRLNGEHASFAILVPDEAAALILKALAWDVRHGDRDAADIWRCLEITNAAGVRPAAFETDDGRKVRDLLRHEFVVSEGEAMKAVRRYYGLSKEETTRRRTRIRALITRVLGTTSTSSDTGSRR